MQPCGAHNRHTELRLLLPFARCHIALLSLSQKCRTFMHQRVMTATTRTSNVTTSRDVSVSLFAPRPRDNSCRSQLATGLVAVSPGQLTTATQTGCHRYRVQSVGGWGVGRGGGGGSMPLVPARCIERAGDVRCFLHRPITERNSDVQCLLHRPIADRGPVMFSAFCTGPSQRETVMFSASCTGPLQTGTVMSSASCTGP